MCKHDTHMLMGTADGILCRACGALFGSFAELEASRNPIEEQAEPAPRKTRGRPKKKEDNV